MKQSSHYCGFLAKTVIFALCIIPLLAGCKHNKPNTTFEKRYLNSDFGCVHNQWEFKYDGKWYPATVPGNIHDDLLANKLIADPFVGDNEKSVQWIADSVWEYRLFFDKNCSEGKSFSHSQLVFEGLDTYAEVVLNGVRLKSTSGDTMSDNMFRRWRYDLPDNLQDKNNELLVRFHPSVTIDSMEAAKLPYRLPDNRVFTRKAQYENGWDWGPKLITCGIWKNVFIESWNDLRINDFYVSDLEPSFDSARPWISQVEIDIDADKILSSELQIQISDDKGYSQSIVQKIDLHQGNNSVKIPVTIENPQLWWPNGLGEQHLYYFTVSLAEEKTDGIPALVHTHGLRTIRLEQKADSIGETFQFYVNGRPVFMRGVNWIPASSYVGTLAGSEGDGVYSDLLQRCADANMNMVRVWGGGIYEHDAFYDCCDRLGLLVWQDFMFACNIYPGNKDFIDNVNIEAAEQVQRLRNHPCIAIFCGNNEVHNGLEDWGWQKQLNHTDAQYEQFYADYDKIFNKTLPDNVRKYASSTPYVHSSPTFGWGHDECTTHGCSHYWGVWWGELPFEVWKDKTGRFMTEYGFQAYPEMATISTFATAAEQTLTSPALQNHQKHARGVQIITKAIEEVYGKFDKNNLSQFTYLSQLTQSYGIAEAIEAHRIQHNRCSGTLIWQLNDCWPVASWSCIDYFGRPKALYYRLHKLFDNLAIASQKDKSGNVEIFVINDNLDNITGNLQWKIVRNDNGDVIDSGRVSMNIPANSSKPAVSIAAPSNKKLLRNCHVYVEFTAADGQVKDYHTYFVKPGELAQGQKPIAFDTKYFDHYAIITVSSESLHQGLFIEETSGLPVIYSNNYFDLLPGREVKVKVEYPNIDKKPKFRFRAL